VNGDEGSEESHVPVLLGQVITGLNIKPGGFYIDATFGRGGHSREILKLLGAEGRLLAIDRDPAAVADAKNRFSQDSRFEIVRGEFAQLTEITVARNLSGKVDGLLFDLGVSSPQLDEAERGFSFRADGPLDMRMDPDQGVSAAEWLAAVDERELKKVLFEFGEEKYAARIAKAIVDRRSVQPMRRTVELAAMISQVVPAHGQRIHPATRSFQAIRIAINKELAQLQQALKASPDVLRAGGRLCVISFHSLEDRMVKRFIRNASSEPEAWRGLPNIPPEYRPRLRTVGRVVKADDAEIAVNARSRSARLRVAEKV
jgi:16S rRNA (cytosine1402-N4)-methyltransferase